MNKAIGYVLVIGGIGALGYLYLYYYLPKKMGMEDAIKKMQETKKNNNKWKFYKKYKIY